MCADRSVEQIPQISQEIFLDRVTQRAYSKSGSGRTFLQSWHRLAEKQITQSKVMHCWGPTLVMRSSGRLIKIYFLGPAIHPFMSRGPISAYLQNCAGSCENNGREVMMVKVIMHIMGS